MNRRILAIVVSGAVALPMAALAQDEEVKVPQHSHPGAYEHEHEMAGEDGAMMMVPAHAHQYDVHPHDELHGHSATVYGSLRFGVRMSDNDTPNSSSMWDLGSNRSSRFGIKGSMDAGEGMTAGFHLERAVGFDNLKARHHNVSLSGGFGTIKFGQQDAPYYGATTWDGSQTLGGLTDFIFRASGVSYASNLGGPFGFHIMAGSGDGGAEAEGDGANHVEAAGSLNTGPVTLTIGYLDDDGGQERIGGTVGGGLARFNWEIGYDSGTDACGMGCDDDRYGAHVGYAVGDGNVYVQYSEMDSDDNMDDTDGWVVGYTHVLATNVVVYAEHGRTNSMNDTDGEVATNTTVFAVKVGF